MQVNAKSRTEVLDRFPHESVTRAALRSAKALDRRTFEAPGRRAWAAWPKCVRTPSAKGRVFATFMEADWATNHALYYVNYNAGAPYRWAWPEIDRVLRRGASLLRALAPAFSRPAAPNQ